MASPTVTVAGAGILGLWQTFTLAGAGFTVRLVEASSEPFVQSASLHAGAMLAPNCEGEDAPPLIARLGHEGLKLWRDAVPGIIDAGTLVVAAARDLPDLERYQRQTGGHRRLDAGEIERLEPDLGQRFPSALFFADEAHIAPHDAMARLLDQSRQAGAKLAFGVSWPDGLTSEIVVDCRGQGARSDLPNLRGIRGERLLIRSSEVTLRRPIRLLHPRHAIYIVPWGDGRYLVGATMIESEDDGPVTVRSALDLLAAAYTLCPALGEAQILEAASGIRPAFPDNVPRAIVRDGGKRILVNGAYRHGFLLAPILARAVAAFLTTGAAHPLIVKE